jgi:hypothetical protein
MQQLAQPSPTSKTITITTATIVPPFQEDNTDGKT